jgi:hypothetical protein
LEVAIYNWPPNRNTGIIRHFGRIEVIVFYPDDFWGFDPWALCQWLRLGLGLRELYCIILEFLEGIGRDVVETVIGELVVEIHL